MASYSNLRVGQGVLELRQVLGLGVELDGLAVVGRVGDGVQGLDYRPGRAHYLNIINI